MSKAFYLASIGGGLGASLLLSLMSLALSATGEDDFIPAALGLLVLGLPLLIYAVAVIMVLIYKMWAAIEDGAPRTSPGLAVGLMFVPLFNVIWLFQVYWGWTVDYNRYIRDRGYNLRKGHHRLPGSLLPVPG